jgi:uncharacterized protein (DUF849 family)
MLIKACLNGGTTRQQHPSVPVTPAELAADASDAVHASAGAGHRSWGARRDVCVWRTH